MANKINRVISRSGLHFVVERELKNTYRPAFRMHEEDIHVDSLWGIESSPFEQSSSITDRSSYRDSREWDA